MQVNNTTNNANQKSTEQQVRASLKKQLWAIANILRGKMNADEYKNYILGFIFYRYLSDEFEKYADSVLQKIAPGKKYAENNLTDKEKNFVKKLVKSKIGFYLEPHELFSYIVKKGKGEIEGADTFIIEDLKQALNKIEQTAQGTDAEEAYVGLFDDVDLNSTKLGKRPQDRNQTIVEVLSKLAEIDFQLNDAESDILGNAYEYLIGEFASEAGKKGGEFYTPAQVSKLLAKLVTLNLPVDKDGKKRIRKAYDPTCGSGSLLLKLKDEAEVLEFYGQELNPTTYNLARMNMLLHRIDPNKFHIRQGDTLEDDQFPDLKADVIVANPPFSAKWKSDENPLFANDPRFAPYGVLAPKSYADYAFVTHMIYHLQDNGHMAIVLPHGTFFRGGREYKIRKYLIEKANVIDAIIGLPANLFYGTSIPAIIMVFRKNRQPGEPILFIDASREFEKGKNQNYLRDKDIEKIVQTYKERKEIDKYSHLATLDEIKENDFNLNIPRYVDTFEEEPEIDIDAVVKEINQLKEQEKHIREKLNKYLEKLGVGKVWRRSYYVQEWCLHTIYWWVWIGEV